MDKLKVQVLDTDAFAKYGTFAQILSPKTEALAGGKDDAIRFWPDAGGTVSLGRLASNEVSIGICEVKERPFLIDEAEFHSFTEEGILPLNGDIIIHVGGPTLDGDLPKKFEVFHVPRGMMVVLKRGVWHHAPFTFMTPKSVSVLVLLPPVTYANDCEKDFLEPGIPFEV